MAFDTDAEPAQFSAASPTVDGAPVGLVRRHRAAAAASVRAAPAQHVPIPGYLLKVYWWTYVHPWAVAVFDHMLVINLI
ncbi:hypothetical protein J8J27_33935, partial [Mycobacterium tuberculosis]|nr:hypothetical protein [Mycobacterium tuberculosis]